MRKSRMMEWYGTRDYVVNFEEKRIAIRLDRTYSAEALVMNGKFSTPHFITLLIEGGHLAEDRDLPVFAYTDDCYG